MLNSEVSISHPFPPTRPNVGIVKSETTIDEIDCVELRWWFAIPQLGDHTMRASYDADTLELRWITDMEATSLAKVHGIDCMELQVNERSVERGWSDNRLVFYACLEDSGESRWIAVISEKEGKKELTTHLDEEFEDQWGASANRCRKLYDDARYELQPDGSYRVTEGRGLGAGVYDVTIGDKTFCCLRVLEVDPAEPGGGELNEVYVERGGRTVLHRRYDGRFLRGVDLLRKYPDHPRITIEDQVYVQSDCTGRAHDDISSTSLGINTRS